MEHGDLARTKKLNNLNLSRVHEIENLVLEIDEKYTWCIIVFTAHP